MAISFFQPRCAQIRGNGMIHFNATGTIAQMAAAAMFVIQNLPLLKICIAGDRRWKSHARKYGGTNKYF